MARPKKEKERFFYDQFYAMSCGEQAIALRILTEHHEYVKQQAKKTKEPASQETTA
jgi:hypothetical protein